MARLETLQQTATQAATAWFARQRSGCWSRTDAAAFAVWLKADAANTAAWASLEKLWGRFDPVRDDPAILALRESARRHATQREVLRRSWRIGVAVAASAVLGVALWWHGRTFVAPLAGSPAQFGVMPAAALIRDAATQIGERSLLVLADGSKVTLNTASAVRADYSGRERRVTLIRGEAFFDVAKDPARPFIVSAGLHQVVAVGTAFDVRLQARQLKVTLLEGKVRVVPAASSQGGAANGPPPGAAITLEPGSVLVAGEDGISRVDRLDAVRATSWRNGELVFDGDRLADVVVEMNRYSRERIEIADPALEERKVSGVFEPNSGPALAKALEAYGIARVARQTATTIVLVSPQ